MTWISILYPTPPRKSGYVFESGDAEAQRRYEALCERLDELYKAVDPESVKARKKRERALPKNKIFKTIGVEKQAPPEPKLKPAKLPNYKTAGFREIENAILSVLRPGMHPISRRAIGDLILESSEWAIDSGRLRKALNTLWMEGALCKARGRDAIACHFWIKPFAVGDRVIEFRNRPSQRQGIVIRIAPHPQKPSSLVPVVRLDSGEEVYSSVDLLSHTHPISQERGVA